MSEMLVKHVTVYDWPVWLSLSVQLSIEFYIAKRLDVDITQHAPICDAP